MKYLVLSLFSGWGGGDRGLHDAGFFTPWAVDWDKHAQKCYKLNFPHTRIEGFDLFKTRIEHVMQTFGIVKGMVDCLLLACPCQGLSNAGKSDPFDERNLLFLRSMRLYIPALQPKVWVLENVAGLNNSNMALFYNLLQDEYERLSGEYIIEQKILNTLHFGVPQDRERYIAIGVHRLLGVQPSYPEPDISEFGKRICDIIPDLDGIRYGYGRKQMKDRTDFCNTITKTPNIWAQRNGEMGDFSIEDLLKFCAYPADWKYEGSSTQLWNRTGNSIMPPFMQAIGDHIRINILEKAGVPKTDIRTFMKQEPHKSP